MSGKVVVYGKDGWPYTLAAKEDLTRRKVPYEYYDVKLNGVAMEKMLQITGGNRKVPVIVDGRDVKIGFGGT